MRSTSPDAGARQRLRTGTINAQRHGPCICGFLLVLQASFLDCVAFDPFSFQQDCLTAAEVDVGRRQIAQALMIAPMVDLATGRRPCRVAGQPLLAGLQELLGPGVIKALGYTLGRLEPDANSICL